MEPRDSVIRPLGLITQRNKYGQYPDGALKNAINVFMRNPGIVEPQPQKETIQDAASDTSYELLRLFPWSTKNLGILDTGAATPLYWYNGASSAAVTAPSGTTFQFSTGCATTAFARQRMLMSMNNDVIAFDSSGDTTPRLAGLPAPGGLSLSSFTTTNAQVYAPSETARYKAVFVDKQSDGYELRSSPSNSATVTSSAAAGSYDAIIRVDFAAAGVLNAIAAGMFIELYRTDIQASGTDPGETFRLVNEYTISSTDISNKYALIRDTTPGDELGAELYTNAGLSDNGENLPPGLADDVFAFKGCMFAAQRNVASFIELRVNSNFGLLSTDPNRQYGIGQRSFTGTTTLGSNVITAVSNMRGLDVGQYVRNGGGFAGDMRITAVNVGASTVTVSINATSSTSGNTFDAFDVIKINGVEYTLDQFGNFLLYVAKQTDPLLGAAASGAIVTGAPDITGSTMAGVEFILQYPWVFNGTLTVSATNGSNYSPVLPALASTPTNGSFDTRYNRLVWSKQDQPEAFAPENELLYGNGTHYRAVVRRDSVLLFASDGAWVLTGEQGPWKVTLLDPKCILAARDACVYTEGGDTYAYTNTGLRRITEGNSIEPVSEGIIGNQINGAEFLDTWDMFMSYDFANNDVWFEEGEGANDTFIYNTLTKSFVSNSDTDTTSHFLYSREIRQMVFATLGDVGADILPTIQTFSNANYRDDVTVDYQPITGDGDAFTVKQFVDCDWLFQAVPTALEITSRFNETASSSGVDAVADGFDWRAHVGTPRGVAVAPRIAPGFSAPTNDEYWQCLGFSTRFTVQSGETRR